MTKRLEARDNPRKVLEPEEDQGYASVLPAVGEKVATKDALEKQRAHENGLLEAAFMLAKEEVLRQVSRLDVW